jgi:CRP-like cAMP-binding protein
MLDDPAIIAALGQVCVSERNCMEDFVIDLGQRDAEERIACLLLRLADRLSARSIFKGGRYPFPLRQQHIGDTVGLSSVHVSRVLAGMRSANVIDISGGVLTILDRERLERIGRVD